jgi:UDP-N-acetyl-2-amino-2-deoxyglucuronate dehydrogenase
MTPNTHVSEVNMMPRFQHAVVGCGRVAPNHVDAAQQLPDWRVGALVDKDATAAQKFADSIGADVQVQSFDEVLADPDITSVSLCVPHHLHVPMATRAIEAGKHTLVEKPLALNHDDAVRLSDLAESAGLVLGVGSQHLYDEPVKEIRRLVSEGALGKILYARVSLEAHREGDYFTGSDWRGSWSTEGGSALVNQGYHAVDVVRDIVGDLSVVAASARNVARDADISTEDTVVAQLESATGTPVAIAVTISASSLWRTRIEIVAETGTFEFDLDHPTRVHRRLNATEPERSTEAATAAPGIDYYGTSHRSLFRDFDHAIRTGESLYSNGVRGAAMVKLIRDIYTTAGVAHA